MIINIKPNKNSNKLFENIRDGLKYIKKCEYEYVNNYITITSNETKVINIVSGVLADYIIENYEKALINRIIKTNYCYFGNDEMKEISSIVVKIIRNEDKNFINSLFQIRRRNLIVRKLIDYFENSDTLIIEGFVNFSLKDYTKDLEDVVAKSVDDFLMDREYNEFIKLLKSFVGVQEPKYEVIYVIKGQNGKYIFLDKNRNVIAYDDILDDYVKDVSKDELNYDDLLVSSLITLAPQKVVLENKETWENKELIKTIETIFSNETIPNKNNILSIVRGGESDDK